MDIIVKSKAAISGEIELPPSKFFTQFATAQALLVEGKSTIEHPLRVKDTLSLLRAIENLGAVVKRTQTSWFIWGVGSELKPNDNVIDAKNSATAFSMLTSISSLAPRTLVMNGDAQLRSRAMPELLKTLNRLGGKVYSAKADESPPFVVFGGSLNGGRVAVDEGCVKYLPALMLPSPYARRPVEFVFKRPLSSGRLELAIELMGKAGVKIKTERKKLKVPTQPYHDFTTKVQSDIIAMAPFIAAAALTDSKLKVNLTHEEKGSSVLLNILDEMGVKLRISKRELVIEGPQRVRAASIDLSEAPELFPVVAVLACMAKGRTHIKNAWEARMMKSDRISAISNAIRRMRAKIKESSDGVIIDGPTKLKGCEVDGCEDYAVVAALFVAGLIADGQTVIKNGAEALRTSYSRFVSTFQRLGAEVSYSD